MLHWHQCRGQMWKWISLMLETVYQTSIGEAEVLCEHLTVQAPAREYQVLAGTMTIAVFLVQHDMGRLAMSRCPAQQARWKSRGVPPAASNISPVAETQAMSKAKAQAMPKVRFCDSSGTDCSGPGRRAKHRLVRLDSVGQGTRGRERDAQGTNSKTTTGCC